MKQLYVQYMPDTAAKQLLLELQNAIGKSISSGKIVPKDQLHVTILHFGFLRETYQQLLTVQPLLDEQRYQAAVRTFIDDVKPLLPISCELTIESLAQFGPQGSVIAIALKGDSALAQAYEQTMKYLQKFGNNLSVPAIADIPYRPRALQVPASLMPHISLLKGVHGKNSAEPIAPFRGKILKLSLFPLT